MVDFSAARLNMVDSQVRINDVTDLRVQDAMRVIPRESLAPPGRAYLAYADAEVPYGPGRALLAPRDVAKLLHGLAIAPGQKALAIAAPYGAAVLEHAGLDVRRLDGDDLTPPSAELFDVIICEGAVVRTPDAWTTALAPGGRLAIIERSGPVGKAVIYTQSSTGLARREIFDATPSYLGGFEPEQGFAF
ncbi:protein-L-isoaspartate O-methyltransferase [Phenylobacterium sp.]|uniref:protein-L-isoaspartate O-methyltransferase family protein n=1 Tax=Phenylobacterium sp. TaxID=1871053 RepID=UPI00273066BC|nr:protein-L-isoaspartate O-methyltransferase [Phenylobacterium sp.]MDP1875730.1 protein-L-isoaspartate O-methyltransferase [Phenylobacterium sp.]MDP3488969.1 protein-L-isoaspartate O-methyltransferase [Phenylobacterium sp.]